MKRFVVYLLILCSILALMPTGSAEAANEAIVVEDEGSKAYVLTVADKAYMLGYADYSALTDVKVDYVVHYCAHEEHAAQKQALAEQLSATLITAVDLPAELQQEGAVIYGKLAFSAEKKAGNLETIDCLGNYLKFAASTNESSVNVRETPTTKGKRVDKLKRGDVLTVVAQVVNDKGEIWYQVELANGKIGYIRSDLLEVADAVPETKENVANQDKKETRYIGNKKSKVFHRPSCDHLPSSKNIVYFSSRSYAVSKGYKPCSHCDP